MREDEANAVIARLTPGEVDELVSLTGRPAGPPWTQEHRRACAAGIAALAVHAHSRLRIPRL
jgi:hypothetical protein